MSFDSTASPPKKPPIDDRSASRSSHRAIPPLHMPFPPLPPASGGYIITADMNEYFRQLTAQVQATNSYLVQILHQLQIISHELDRKHGKLPSGGDVNINLYQYPPQQQPQQSQPSQSSN